MRDIAFAADSPEPLSASLVNSVDTEEGARAVVAFIHLF